MAVVLGEDGVRRARRSHRGVAYLVRVVIDPLAPRNLPLTKFAQKNAFISDSTVAQAHPDNRPWVTDGRCAD
jgi:hypothetical protein